METQNFMVIMTPWVIPVITSLIQIVGHVDPFNPLDQPVARAFGEVGLEIEENSCYGFI